MHAPDMAEIESEKIKANIRARAESGTERPRQIIANITAGVSREAATILPSYSASQRTVQRKRKRPDANNPRPSSVRDIVLLTIYTLIDLFRQEQDLTEQAILRIQNGITNAQMASKSKYIQLSRRLAAIIPTYGKRAVQLPSLMLVYHL